MLDLNDLAARIKAGEHIPDEELKEAISQLRAGRGTAMQGEKKGKKTRKAAGEELLAKLLSGMD